MLQVSRCYFHHITLYHRWWSLAWFLLILIFLALTSSIFVLADPKCICFGVRGAGGWKSRIPVTSHEDSSTLEKGVSNTRGHQMIERCGKSHETSLPVAHSPKAIRGPRSFDTSNTHHRRFSGSWEAIQNHKPSGLGEICQTWSKASEATKGRT